MNKHFQELAEIVGRAMAKRWMRRSGGGSAPAESTGDAKAPAAAPTPPARRRIRHRQHR